MKLHEYAAHDAIGLAGLVRSREINAQELVRLAREAHDQINPQINAVIEFYDDAETAPVTEQGLFQGVPFLRKDAGATEAGRLQERGSRLFRGQRAMTDSYLIVHARKGGLRTVGRTTTPELGISGMSESHLHGITGNPWNVKLTAGGSSAGAAAAIAAGIVPIAHGNDGGGSIRTPAANCGLVGLNPSRGRISGGPSQQDPRFGLAREFVLCRSIRDMAAALDVLSGPCTGDPYIIIQPNRPFSEELDQPTGRLRVGVARTKWADIDVDAEIMAAVDAVAAILDRMGHSTEEMKAPLAPGDYSRIIMGISDLAVGVFEHAAKTIGRTLSSETLEPINLKLIEHGRNLPLSQSWEVHGAIRQMRADVAWAIKDFDILVTPTMPVLPLPHGGVYCATNDTFSAEEWMDADASLYQYLGVFTVTGQPSVSLPLAQSFSGLPIGIQIVGRFGDEQTLIRVARDLEEAMPWMGRRPPICAGNH